MILKNVEKTDKNQVKLEIVVDKGEFEAAIEKSFKKNAARFNVQGAYPEVYSAAVKEAGIEPVDRAEVELDSIGPDGFTFTAVVTVKPEVKLGQYKNLEAEFIPATVTDEDVDKELENRRKRNGRLLYHILPIQLAIDQYYERQMDMADLALEQHKAKQRLAALERKECASGC